MTIAVIKVLPVEESVKAYYGGVDYITLRVPIVVVSDDESEYISCKGHHGKWYKRHRRNVYTMSHFMERCMSVTMVDGVAIPNIYFSYNAEGKVEHMIGLESSFEERVSSALSHMRNREWHLGQISANNKRYASK